MEISNESEFLDYFEKNKLLFKEFFLLLEGDVSRKIQDTLSAGGYCFYDITQCKVRLGNVKEPQNPIVPKEKNSSKEEIKNVQEPSYKMKVFDKPIRSGEEFSEDLPVSVFGRVNSGAKLFCSQNVTVYGIIDGLVQCDGEYMILQGLSQRGNVIFHGEIVEKNMLREGVLQKISMCDGKIDVKELV